MTHDLDDILTASAAAGPSPDGLEALVWSRVEVLRGERLASQLRLGAVALALATGLAVGGVGAVAAPRPPGDMAIFTVGADLSPLTGLGSSR
ncbi:hypothetical protein [Brevundimonas sp.]|uniref:hypothetical protein n=1 Tax=Brevundimonas sp. TaxID=1871086 RepID=UPI002737A86A|nr:hypothetical protein [Brevundimonas sp.]MDP3801912.1 hypothetical protein [Brevundimonas sp.]